jgi:hypothetical protein
MMKPYLVLPFAFIFWELKKFVLVFSTTENGGWMITIQKKFTFLKLEVLNLKLAVRKVFLKEICLIDVNLGSLCTKKIGIF